MSTTTTISFDLLYSIRETQLQHGLRSDDFAKYHAYCTGRIKTLRKQLKLSNAHKIVSSNKKKSSNNNNNNKNDQNNNDKKKSDSNKQQGTYVPPTQVTENNCKDPRSIMLLALTVERCWAESEELRHAKTGPQDSDLMQRHQGNPNIVMRHSRARLSRAVQMTKRLVEVVDKVGDDELKKQTHAYAKSIHGRFAFTSGDFATSKEQFLGARKLFHEMVLSTSKKSTSNSNNATASSTSSSKSSKKESNAAASSHVLAIDLRTECDDRIITCMRSLGEDASTYKPATETGVGAGGAAASGASQDMMSALSWLGRQIPITNFQVQNALRRFDGLEAFQTASSLLSSAAAVEDTNGTDGMAWWIFQQQSSFNKMQDTFDRAVGALNDAQDAVSADLTNHTNASTRGVGGAAGGSSASQQNKNIDESAIIDELRLTQHCLKFRSLMCIVARAYLAAWSLGSRFLLSTELLNTTNNNNSNKDDADQASSASSTTRLPSKRLTNLPSSVATATKELPFTLQHVVSPLDVVRLFDAVLNSIEEALLLPGVDGEDSIEVMKEVIRSDRLFFVASGWQVVARSSTTSGSDNASEESFSRCVSALSHCEKILNSIEKKYPENGKARKDWSENFGFTCPVLAGFSRALLVRRAAASRISATALSSVQDLSTIMSTASSGNGIDDTINSGNSTNAGEKKKSGGGSSSAPMMTISQRLNKSSSSASSSSRHVASEKLQEFVTCSAFTDFPPDFQSAPAKPAFVDIAGTYAEDYLAGLDDDNDDAPTANANNNKKPSSAETTNNKPKQNTNNNTQGGAAAAAGGGDQQQQSGGGSWLGWLRGS